MQTLLYPVPPAPLLEKCLEYTGDAPPDVRYIGIFWDPAGDEGMVTNGRVTYTSDSHAILIYENFLSSLGMTIHFGNSDEPAEKWLIVDLQERKLLAAPVAEARQFLEEQWPPMPVDYSDGFTPEDMQALIDNYLSGAEPEVIPLAVIQKRVLDRTDLLAQLQHWIDAEMRKQCLN